MFVMTYFKNIFIEYITAKLYSILHWKSENFCDLIDIKL